jgi:hypothetical protein
LANPAANAETAARMRAAKGYVGRLPGQKNKITKDLKKVYLGAFDALGGLEGLIAWGKKSPDLFYSQISKLLPKGIEIKSDQELTINIITAIPEPLPLPAEFARVIENPASEDAPEQTLRSPPIHGHGQKETKKEVKSGNTENPKVSQKGQNTTIIVS